VFTLVFGEVSWDAMNLCATAKDCGVAQFYCPAQIDPPRAEAGGLVEGSRTGQSGAARPAALKDLQEPAARDRTFVWEGSGLCATRFEPELGGRAEEVGEAQSRIAGDGARAVENSGDAVGRHLKLARERSGAHVEFLQFFR
jgi:hypothetical protein